MKPVFCSVQHPDLAGSLRRRDCGSGTHTTLYSPKIRPPARGGALVVWSQMPPLCMRYGRVPHWNSSSFFGDWEYLLTGASFPVFQSQNSSHGNQIQQLTQLLTFPLGLHEFTKKKKKLVFWLLTSHLLPRVWRPYLVAVSNLQDHLLMALGDKTQHI